MSDSTKSPLRRIVLMVDEDDYRDIQKEFAERQVAGDPLPEGDSELAGGMVGEIVRDLWEYRHLWNAEHKGDE